MMPALSHRPARRVLALALLAASVACGDDDTSSAAAGGGSTPSECVPPDASTEPDSCDEAIALALTPRPAAECTSFCVEVAGCAYDESGGDPALKQTYVDGACATVSCTDGTATLLGPMIDACSGTSCGEMQVCLDDARASYGAIADCGDELSRDLLERLAHILCLLQELLDTIVCIATFFAAC